MSGNYCVRIGGHPIGVTAPNARAALTIALAEWSPPEFEQLAERVESRRITISVQRIEDGGK